MIKPVLLCAALAVSVSGCARLADSRLNPLNWFGSSTSAPATPDGEIRPLIPENRVVQVVDGRTLLSSVTALSVDRTASGAIIRATGLAPTQGYFNAELIPVSSEGGTLVLDFRAQAPAGFEIEGSARSREITAAYALDVTELAAIRTIRVQALTNTRSTRR